MPAMSAQSHDARDWLEAQRWQVRSRDWEFALRQISRGSYLECRRAVTTLGWLCRDLEKELGGTGRESEAPGHSEDALSQLRLILQGFQRELDRFNTQGELGDLLPLGRALLSYLSALSELEAAGLYPAPADRTSLSA